MAEPATEAPSIPSVQVSSEEGVRTRERHGCRLAALVRLHLPALSRSSVAWVHDLSIAGIGCELLYPLEPGTKIIFLVRSPGDQHDIELPAEVMHATPADVFYRVGCRFAEPLAEDLFTVVLDKMRKL